jgi:hypothetical protein
MLGLGDQRIVVGFLTITHIVLLHYIQTFCLLPAQPLTQWVLGLAALELNLTTPN